MHPNPAFRKATVEQNVAFARERAFGVLTVATDGAPLAAHVPFVLSPDGRTARLHLARSNAILRGNDWPRAARLVVSGPDSYVSADWYGIAAQVPTWNYVAVHLVGSIAVMDPAELGPHLADLSAFFERRLAPKAPWTLDKLEAGLRERLFRAIVPVELSVETVEGTRKLSQNKPADARRMAAAEVWAHGIGQDWASLAALMLGAADAD